MPRNKIPYEVEDQTIEYPYLKQIVRNISRGERVPDGTIIQSIEQVDTYVGGWIQAGWKLITAFRLGEMPEGAIQMMYILAKDPPIGL